MKTLIKLFLILAALFASTFVVIKVTGVITVDDIRNWLEAAKSVSPLAIGLVVVALLFADLFIAIPNLTVSILSGYFLGFELGAFFNIVGVSAAGITGYFLSRWMGRKLLERIVRDPQEIKEMESIFNRHGFVMILLSWALPILPEVSACLAGFTRMPLWKFLLPMLRSRPHASTRRCCHRARRQAVRRARSPQPSRRPRQCLQDGSGPCT